MPNRNESIIYRNVDSISILKFPSRKQLKYFSVGQLICMLHTEPYNGILIDSKKEQVKFITWVKKPYHAYECTHKEFRKYKMNL